MKVKQKLQTGQLKNNFGRQFGGYEFLISSSISFGERVKDDYRKEVFSIAAWLLWNRRNAIHFRRPVRPMAQILSTAGNLLQDFLAV
ncbi:hypothetical protein SO802_031901 [Lithocarpus litseifolius]|uniref:Uncharacterized protein n=1 Tax=Lithocarpus litseifolius TaxID=425828 RepID=A0AAW2BQ19_9ROSI